MSNIVIFGGGTLSHVRNHLGLCAWSRGTTARRLKQLLPQADLVLTAMGSESSKIVTYIDLCSEVHRVCADKNVSVIVMSCAVLDFEGEVGGEVSGKHANRLQSREPGHTLQLRAVPKVIEDIKHLRPDIKIVGFKTTTNESIEVMREKSKRMGVDYVIANDVVTRINLLNGVRMERDACLHELANQLDVRKGILAVDARGWYVRLGTRGYVDRNVAYKAARAILLEAGYEDFGTRYHWSTRMEGVLWISRR